jgi:hypothetical protein
MIAFAEVLREARGNQAGRYKGHIKLAGRHRPENLEIRKKQMDRLSGDKDVPTHQQS